MIEFKGKKYTPKQYNKMVDNCGHKNVTLFKKAKLLIGYLYFYNCKDCGILVGYMEER